MGGSVVPPLGDERLKRSESVRAIAHGLKLFIKIFAGFIALYFGFLTLSEAPLDKAATVFTPSGINKIGLFILFFCWLLGAQEDVSILDMAFSHDGQANLGWPVIASIIAFCIFFFVLFYTSDKAIIFQLSVLMVLSLNVLGWRRVINRASPMIESTQRVAIDDGNEIAYLKCVVGIGYIDGRWQRLRFIYMAALALVQLAIAIAIYAKLVPAQIESLKFGDVGVGQLVSYLPGGVFIFYVVTSEFWMSIYRAKAYSDFHLLDFIGEKFNVNAKKSSPMQEWRVKAPLSLEKDIFKGYNGTIDIPFL